MEGKEKQNLPLLTLAQCGCMVHALHGKVGKVGKVVHAVEAEKGGRVDALVAFWPHSGLRFLSFRFGVRGHFSRSSGTLSPDSRVYRGG